MLRTFDAFRFHDFELSPKYEDVQRGIALFREQNCDCVIGVGGGSVMDMAKSVAIFAYQPEALNDRNISKREVPLIAIPTTAGTGSESTHFAVIYIGKEKHSIAQQSMLPDYAILDPEFTLGLPPYITACTGMDALCQGIESFWSVHSTAASRVYSEKGIKLALDNIVKAVNEPDRESRENMLTASHLCGSAINLAFTTAAHAVSYPLTSYFGIAHGHAVALTLPHFILFNGGVNEETCQDSRGLPFVRDRLQELMRILGVRDTSEAAGKLLGIMDAIGLAQRLSDFGIKDRDLSTIVKNGFNPNRVKNNPRTLTADGLETLLRGIL
jgi:alcohol dehydrogenase class IV